MTVDESDTDILEALEAARPGSGHPPAQSLREAGRRGLGDSDLFLRLYDRFAGPASGPERCRRWLRGIGSGPVHRGDRRASLERRDRQFAWSALREAAACGGHDAAVTRMEAALTSGGLPSPSAQAYLPVDPTAAVGVAAALRDSGAPTPLIERACRALVEWGMTPGGTSSAAYELQILIDGPEIGDPDARARLDLLAEGLMRHGILDRTPHREVVAGGNDRGDVIELLEAAGLAVTIPDEASTAPPEYDVFLRDIARISRGAFVVDGPVSVETTGDGVLVRWTESGRPRELIAEDRGDWVDRLALFELCGSLPTDDGRTLTCLEELENEHQLVVAVVPDEGWAHFCTEFGLGTQTPG